MTSNLIMNTPLEENPCGIVCAVDMDSTQVHFLLPQTSSTFSLEIGDACYYDTAEKSSFFNHLVVKNNKQKLRSVIPMTKEEASFVCQRMFYANLEASKQ